MKKMRSVIIDDEPGNIITLTELVKAYCPQVEIAGTAKDSVEAKEVIDTLKPDLVFLDIEMPYGNAFSLLDDIGFINFEIIFITAFNDYAIKAFKYAAIDYLLKPVSINELKASVERAFSRVDEKGTNSRVNALLASLKQDHQTEKIGLPTKDGFHFESLKNIMFLEAQGSYTNVYLKGNTHELVSKTLSYFDDILPSSIFCRVHNSHIVNLNYIKKYFKGRGGYVEMENGALIEISSRKKDEFLSRFVH